MKKRLIERGITWCVAIFYADWSLGGEQIGEGKRTFYEGQ